MGTAFAGAVHKGDGGSNRPLLEPLAAGSRVRRDGDGRALSIAAAACAVCDGQGVGAGGRRREGTVPRRVCSHIGAARMVGNGAVVHDRTFVYDRAVVYDCPGIGDGKRAALRNGKGAARIHGYGGCSGIDVGDAHIAAYGDVARNGNGAISGNSPCAGMGGDRAAGKRYIAVNRSHRRIAELSRSAAGDRAAVDDDIIVSINSRIACTCDRTAGMDGDIYR